MAILPATTATQAADRAAEHPQEEGAAATGSDYSGLASDSNSDFLDLVFHYADHNVCHTYRKLF